MAIYKSKIAYKINNNSPEIKTPRKLHVKMTLNDQNALRNITIDLSTTGREIESPESIAIHTISINQINSLLSIYKAEHTYIAEANYSSYGVLHCKINKTIYPYTKDETFDYVTSVTATLYACQMAYVLTGSTIIHDEFAGKINFDDGLRVPSIGDFNKLRNDAKLKFIRMDTDYLREVKNDFPIHGAMKIEWIKYRRGKLFLQFKFCIGNGIYGNILTALA